MISIRNVTKYYPMRKGEVHYVLKDVNLEIPSHHSVAIIGPNGSGKSTLLRMIGGAEAPNSGSIVTRSRISWPLGLGIGFQGSLTGRQNIDFVCQINGLNQEQRDQVLEHVINFAELGKFFDMPVKSYSSGMRARLGFGLSISFDFDCYLIDELTSVGDIIFKKKAKKAFQQISKTSSLIYVSHSLGSLKKYCQSGIFLREGEATYYEKVQDAIDAYEAYIKDRGGSLKRSARKTPMASKSAVRKKARKLARKMAHKMARKMANKMVDKTAEKSTNKEFQPKQNDL